MTKVSRTVLMPRDLTSKTLGDWIGAITRFDEAGWPLAIVGNCDSKDPLDGLAMAAFCSARTQQIGLCATIDPDTVEPFTLARGLATLDHMSHGRAAWKLSHCNNIERSLEMIETVRKLLASWDADALVEDHANGILSSSEKVHTVAHEGKYFSVEGPLNIPRPPQGRVPLIAFADEGAVSGAADLVVNEETLWHVTLDQLPEASLTVPRKIDAPFLLRAARE